jgi:DNA repair protein RecO (recombination protein O)
MDRQRIQLQPAYLLHQRPYGDTGALLEAFSHDYGRVGVIAKGIRSGRSRRQAVLQSFAELLLSWVTRGELATLTDVEALETPRELKGTRLISGFYLNELLIRLLRRDDPHPELFEDYRWAVNGLAAGAEEAPLLRVFEKRLLERLGYGLQLELDILGDAIDPDASYRYRPEEGAELVIGQEPAAAVSGRALLALAHESDDLSVHERALRRITRAALAPHLGPQPLRSRELYLQFRHPPSGGVHDQA